MNPPTVDNDTLAAAIRIARQGAALSLQWFGTDKLEVQAKGDGSPVTQADHAVETFVREQLRTHFPDDSILGEEQGVQEGRSGRQWIIDPIDGTYPFTRGVPLYSSLLALVDEHGPAIGVIVVPALDEIVWAGRGSGCFHNGARCHVSTVSSLAGACVTTSGYGWWTEQLMVAMRREEAWLQAWGDGYGAMMVATGRADAMIDIGLAPWDIAPLNVIISEAGGRMTSLNGEDRPYEGSIVASNGLIHNAILRTATAAEGRLMENDR